MIVSAALLNEGIKPRAVAALILIIGGILVQNLPGRHPRVHVPAGQR